MQIEQRFFAVCHVYVCIKLTNLEKSLDGSPFKRMVQIVFNAPSKSGKKIKNCNSAHTVRRMRIFSVEIIYYDTLLMFFCG